MYSEHGALMASTIVKSDKAVAMSVYVIRSFIEIRKQLMTNTTILKRLSEVEKTLLQHDQSLWDLYQKLLPLLQPPPLKNRRRAGFASDVED